MLTLNGMIKKINLERLFIFSYDYDYDYYYGMNSYANGEPYQDDASVSWQTGWLDAQDADMNEKIS